MIKKYIKFMKPALLTVALFLFAAVANGAWAQVSSGAAAIMTDSTVNDTAGKSVIAQVYNIIKFAYVFFYAVAVLLVAQSWMQFKQQKYDAMFASMGAALGLFLTPAIIDFIHGLGVNSAKNTANAGVI